MRGKSRKLSGAGGRRWRPARVVAAFALPSAGAAAAATSLVPATLEEEARCPLSKFSITRTTTTVERRSDLLEGATSARWRRLQQSPRRRRWRRRQWARMVCVAAVSCPPHVR